MTEENQETTESISPSTPYRVLARKYRPRHFDELIGQDALVRTLSNAIESGRIAQAYMLTGVRGVGKTTTARIIAKALNYKGPDGNAGPTTGPTDDCEICRAITEDRHPDVMEMDAASRTGVDDIREILDGVRYAPTQARYKVYIIDEVHMLSKAAFNALLKTLEEPPAHVIFIFATTEIRKVPVTVLSRCQRFDLRRVDVPTLSDFYMQISGKENVEAEEEAIALIARAADGSVRDGLSLLDQAIALSSEKITTQQVQDMLGLADRGLILDALEAALKGNTKTALDIAEDLYKKGADPIVVIQDMLDFTHLLTRLRAVPAQKEGYTAIAQDTLDRASELSSKLSMPSLGRAWQILLKGLNEVQNAPNTQAAAEMIIIRLAYAADLPDPGDLLKRLKNGEGAVAAGSGAVQSSGGGSAPAASLNGKPELSVVPQVELITSINSIEELEAALRTRKYAILSGQVFNYVHLVKLEFGRLEFRPAEDAPQSLAQDLTKALNDITNTRWMVTLSKEQGLPTMFEVENAQTLRLMNEAKEHPAVKTVFELFPGAKLSVKTG